MLILTSLSFWGRAMVNEYIMYMHKSRTHPDDDVHKCERIAHHRGPLSIIGGWADVTLRKQELMFPDAAAPPPPHSCPPSLYCNSLIKIRRPRMVWKK